MVPRSPWNEFNLPPGSTHSIYLHYELVSQNNGLFLDLPIDYSGKQFAIVALGNTGSNPGKVNSWIDHTYPNYNEDNKVTIWSGSVYTSDVILKLNATNCSTGISCYNGHNGIDFQHNYSQAKELIYAAAPGKVKEVHRTYPQAGPRGKLYGNYVLIDHGSGYATFYAHLAEVSSGIVVGTDITDVKNTPIGVMGGTGGFPIHLHFGVYYDNNKNGVWEEVYRGYTEAIDPYGWLGKDKDPADIGSTYLWKYPLSSKTMVSSADTTLMSATGTGKVTVPEGALPSGTFIELWDLPSFGSQLTSLRPVNQALLFNILDSSISAKPASSTLPSDLAFAASLSVTYENEDVKHLDISKGAISQWDSNIEEWIGLQTIVLIDEMEATAAITDTGTFILQAPLLCPDDIDESNDHYDLSRVISPSNASSSHVFDVIGDEDWFKFEAIADELFDIEVKKSTAGLKFTLEVYDIDGTTLSELEDYQESDQELSAKWRAPFSGEYFIRIASSNDSSYGCSASYSLTLHWPTHLYLPVITKK